eukprot:12353633-Alexandrium_andersonii.AAC.1
MLEGDALRRALATLGRLCVQHLAGACNYSLCNKHHPGPDEAARFVVLAARVQCEEGLACRRVNCIFWHPPGHQPSGVAVARIRAALPRARRRAEA